MGKRILKLAFGALLLFGAYEAGKHDDIVRVVKQEIYVKAKDGSYSEKIGKIEDSIAKKLYEIDSKSEGVQPGFMKRINDYSRKLLGMKTGEEGRRDREERYKALTDPNNPNVNTINLENRLHGYRN
jgi:hypothetical protein